MIDESIGLWGLFLSAFVSATIAPGGSEVLLAYMVSETTFNLEVMVLIATIGNTLGASITWFFGVLAAKKIPVETSLTEKKQKTLRWVKKWGMWSLLFSWLPLIGDGLCFAGGWLKLPFVISTVVIFVGKAIRYIFVAYILNLG